MFDWAAVFDNPELIQALATILAAVAAIVLMLVFVAIGVDRVIVIWRMVRGRTAELVELVDEIDDPAIVWLDEQLDRISPDEWEQRLVDFLPAFINRLATSLDIAFKIDTETGEVQVVPLEKKDGDKPTP